MPWRRGDQESNGMKQNPEGEEIDKLDWVVYHWIVHLVVFIGIGVLALDASPSPEQELQLWFAGAACLASLLIGVINCAWGKRTLRRMIALVLALINPFLVALAVGLTHGDLNEVAISITVYGLLSIAMCPRPAAVLIALEGLAMVVYFKSMFGNGGESLSAGHIAELAVAYLGVASIALGWRFVIFRIYTFFTHDMGLCVQSLKDEICSLSTERERHRESLARHIIELEEVIEMCDGQADTET